MARSAPALVGRDLVAEVMPNGESAWSDPLDESATPLPQPSVGGVFEPVASVKGTPAVSAARKA